MSLWTLRYADSPPEWGAGVWPLWVSHGRAESGAKAAAMIANRGSYARQLVQTIYVTVGFAALAWIFSWQYAGHCR